jgi:hypothetical protein
LSTRDRSLTVITVFVVPLRSVSFVPFAARTAILRPGPTDALSFAGGGGAVTLPTVNEPCMTPACGSHWNLYVPSWSVTLHVTSTASPTGVAMFTPGPNRWKSWISESSCTWIVYVPASRCVTGVPPASLSEMLKPSPTPTVATSTGLSACAAADGSRTAAASEAARTASRAGMRETPCKR